MPLSLVDKGEYATANGQLRINHGRAPATVVEVQESYPPAPFCSSATKLLPVINRVGGIQYRHLTREL